MASFGEILKISSTLPGVIQGFGGILAKSRVKSQDFTLEIHRQPSGVLLRISDGSFLGQFWPGIAARGVSERHLEPQIWIKSDDFQGRSETPLAAIPGQVR